MHGAASRCSGEGGEAVGLSACDVEGAPLHFMPLSGTARAQ
jgi:hypothetical protein